MTKREELVSAMESFAGASKGNAKHKEILDIYNSCKPLPRGVKMLTSYAWCCATVVYHHPYRGSAYQKSIKASPR